MNDLLEKPPNARLLDGIRAQDPDVMKLDVSLRALAVSSCTFIGVHTIVMPLDLTDDAPLASSLTDALVFVGLMSLGSFVVVLVRSIDPSRPSNRVSKALMLSRLMTLPSSPSTILPKL
jgi:hypothetical protein